MSEMIKSGSKKQLRRAAKDNLKDVEGRLGGKEDRTWDEETQLIDAASWVHAFKKDKKKG